MTDGFPKRSVVHISPTLCKKAYSQSAPEVYAPWNEASGSALCCQSCTGTSAWMQALHNMISDRALFFTSSLSSEVIQIGLGSSAVFKAKSLFSFIHPSHKTILLSLCSVPLLHCRLLLLLSFSKFFMLRVLPQSPSNCSVHFFSHRVLLISVFCTFAQRLVLGEFLYKCGSFSCYIVIPPAFLLRFFM